jgi:hypothetical protein
VAADDPSHVIPTPGEYFDNHPDMRGVDVFLSATKSSAQGAR